VFVPFSFSWRSASEIQGGSLGSCRSPAVHRCGGELYLVFVFSGSWSLRLGLFMLVGGWFPFKSPSSLFVARFGFSHHHHLPCGSGQWLFVVDVSFMFLVVGGGLYSVCSLICSCFCSRFFYYSVCYFLLFCVHIVFRDWVVAFGFVNPKVFGSISLKGFCWLFYRVRLIPRSEFDYVCS
jgi:hypothetical protein